MSFLRCYWVAVLGKDFHDPSMVQPNLSQWPHASLKTSHNNLSSKFKMGHHTLCNKWGCLHDLNIHLVYIFQNSYKSRVTNVSNFMHTCKFNIWHTQCGLGLHFTGSQVTAMCILSQEASHLHNHVGRSSKGNLQQLSYTNGYEHPDHII